MKKEEPLCFSTFDDTIFLVFEQRARHLRFALDYANYVADLEGHTKYHKTNCPLHLLGAFSCPGQDRFEEIKAGE